MFTSDDHRYMAQALLLAERGLYSTDPNPRVGCVLVKDGCVVGEGFHLRAGEAHAEVNALLMAGEAARGATAYVTLEPCCHHGRTPPCSQGLIDAGVVRVVAAMTDPNPLVAGNGLKHLEEAGIETHRGLMQAQAEALNPGFIQRMRAGRPFVRSKLAMSLDGRSAMASGESKWITGDAARADVQRLRARSAAIVTGIGTVLADDPQLDVRAPELIDVVRAPLRVVVDTSLRMPAEARMLELEGATCVICGEHADAQPSTALRDAGAEVVCLAEHNGHVDLHALMQLLAQREINEVLLEAGSVLNGQFLQAGLIDELVIYLAPHIMGAAAKGLFELPGLETMADRVDLRLLDSRMVGDDMRLTWAVEDRGE
jgi:diaminohydroxyphosphoribosylaminopyrimidine deaminase/5-amino-6-(5-phosphoribosylamino)uracil reductase